MWEPGLVTVSRVGPEITDPVDDGPRAGELEDVLRANGLDASAT